MNTYKKQIGVLSLITSMIIILIGVSIIFSNINNESNAQQLSDSAITTSVPQERITGTGDKMIKGGDFCDFLSDVSMTPLSDNWGDGIEYRIIITGVDGESDCSYAFTPGDNGFTPSKNDDGKTYIVHYQLQKNEKGAGWQDCAGVTATKKTNCLYS